MGNELHYRHTLHLAVMAAHDGFTEQAEEELLNLTADQRTEVAETLQELGDILDRVRRRVDF